MNTSPISVVQSKFNFAVEKFPLFGVENTPTPFYGLFRSDTNKAVGKPVSHQYVPHQTEDVIALVDAASEALGGIADIDCSFDNGHYVRVQPSKEYRQSIYGTKDNIFPRVMIRAGYDGRAFRAEMGYYRDACSNLHIMRFVRGTIVKIRHTSGLRDKMAELISTFGDLQQSWSVVAETAQRLQAAKINLPEYLKTVFGNEPTEEGRGLTMYRNRMDSIIQRITRERAATERGAMENGVVSAWEALNGVQGYVQHDARRRGNLTSFERAIAANNDSYVLRAERTALDLAMVT